jgi:hypothetical protein
MPNIRLEFTLETPEETQTLRSTILGLGSPQKERRLHSSEAHGQQTPSFISDETVGLQTTGLIVAIPERRIYVLHGRSPEEVRTPSLFHGLFLVRKYKVWEYADIYLRKPIEFQIYPESNSLPVPRQLDIASRQETDGTYSLVFHTIYHINYIQKFASSADEIDYPDCKIMPREDDLVVDFPDVAEAKEFFEYVCESQDHIWELKKWYVGKYSSPYFHCSEMYRSICEAPYSLPGLISRITKNADKDNEAEVSIWKEHHSPGTSNTSSAPAAPDASPQEHHLLIRWKNPAIENKWLTGTAVLEPFMPCDMQVENISRGRFLDTEHMTAVHPLGKLPVTTPKVIHKTRIYPGMSL